MGVGVAVGTIVGVAVGYRVGVGAAVEVGVGTRVDVGSGVLVGAGVGTACPPPQPAANRIAVIPGISRPTLNNFISYPRGCANHPINF